MIGYEDQVLKTNLKPQQDLKLRSPSTVMRLERMGSFHQTRISFMRSLLRNLKRENWHIKCTRWQIDEKGVGHAVYSAIGPRNTYSLVAFSHDLPPEQRSDRVIATAWDATFCMYDGIPDDADIERLSQNVPKQEAGRISSKELSLSRANRSVRFWQHVVDRLSEGNQPDMELVADVGYLMRTTAVYGSGKFGAADRGLVKDRMLMVNPFHIEMLSVYLTRSFTIDLVEHMAKVKGGDNATQLDKAIRRIIGIGNSTGLGMAPFLINHPKLINQWMVMRETALARVCAVEGADSESIYIFKNVLARAQINADHWQSAHPIQIDKIKALKHDLETLSAYVEDYNFGVLHPWRYLYEWGEENLSLEGQEQLVALMMEPYGDLVDELASQMSVDESTAHVINGLHSVGEVKRFLSENYDWALSVDYEKKKNSHFYWYVSEAKLEPRLGERYNEDNASYEQPLCIGRDVKTLYETLQPYDGEVSLADFLMEHSEMRHTVRRVQLLEQNPYCEVHDNLIGHELLAINLLRCKLSFFGATKFDPRSDRWVRICMYQNAPFPDELATMDESEWAYPALDFAEEKGRTNDNI